MIMRRQIAMPHPSSLDHTFHVPTPTVTIETATRMASYYGYTGPETPTEYLENHIFPTLLPGMEEMLRVSDTTERRKRFNYLDYITTYLYRNNPIHSGRDDIAMKEIPFVREKWASSPRPPLPLSAILTEDEAATIIQAHFRGYLVRITPEAQLFRTWQRNVRKERVAALQIQTFWKNKSVAKGNPNPESNLSETRESTELEVIEPGTDGPSEPGIIGTDGPSESSKKTRKCILNH